MSGRRAMLGLGRRVDAPEVDLLVAVNAFPRLSETFVLHELLDLERRGLRLHIVALQQPEEPVQHEALTELRAGVEYVPVLRGSRRKLAVRAAHTALLLQRGPRYLGGLADAARSPDFTHAHLQRAAMLAHRILRLGSPPVYIHFAHKPATLARIAALLAGVPYGLSAHAKDIWLTPPAELAAKVRDARVVLTCTDEGRRHLEGLSRGLTPVHLAYHGVDVAALRPPTRPSSEPMILSVGRLVEKKGHATLLRAAALLRDRRVAFSLRIAGEGLEWPRLQRLVHELGLSTQVTFLGPLTQAEVREEYARAAIFALPCQQLPNGDRDGIPNVILEAMAHGLPAVSTTLASISEAMVHGESGILVPPEDEHALADALERLLADAGLRAKIGAAARARVAERFDRVANLPAVYAALREAGLVRPTPAGFAGAPPSTGDYSAAA